MQIHQADISQLSHDASDREGFWVSFLNKSGARSLAEVGVFRGAFAERVLGDCPALERYYMIDPWRHLEDWNKPANRGEDEFQQMYLQAMDRTAAFEGKRVVLRGKTTEVVGEIPDESLDFAYVDGDHTLRGITIDLVRMFPKVRPGGWIGGDDFCPTIFQHSSRFEPTLVFPYAVYFAEAVGCPIYGLPHEQFAILKDPDAGHGFHDLTGAYDGVTLKHHLARQRLPGRRAAGKPATAPTAQPASPRADGKSMQRSLPRGLRPLADRLRRKA